MRIYECGSTHSLNPGARSTTVDFVDSERQRANHSLTVVLTQMLVVYRWMPHHCLSGTEVLRLLLEP